LLTFPPENEPERGAVLDALARAVVRLATAEKPVFLTKIDGDSPNASPLAGRLQAAGFVMTSSGLLLRRRGASSAGRVADDHADDGDGMTEPTDA
jgi:hypothetical protein